MLHQIINQVQVNYLYIYIYIYYIDENCPPNASLELEYIYGYRCHDSRNNLRYD